MYKLKEFLNIMEEFAPLSLSCKMIERGDYDNSGIIVHNHDQVKSVLFSLDLSEEAVFCAIKEGADTIVTHHPAIYMPIKNLSSTGETKALLLEIKNNINVISMHLNLDVAENGIDKCLSECLGAKKSVLLDVVDKGAGYGREFEIDKISLTDFTKKLNEKLNTNKIISYGEKEVVAIEMAMEKFIRDYLVKGIGYSKFITHNNGFATNQELDGGLPADAMTILTGLNTHKIRKEEIKAGTIEALFDNKSYFCTNMNNEFTGTSSFHAVVVVDYDDENIYYDDSNNKSGEPISMKKEDFYRMCNSIHYANSGEMLDKNAQRYFQRKFGI
jgi:putative NIF3 family GTP cyclohydrolase 1 type 2